jgi:hypothetical protein
MHWQSKNVIADGLYHIGIRTQDIPNRGVLFPSRAWEDKLICFPLVLPMGWSHFPPIYTASMETVADLANQHLKQCIPIQAPILDAVSETAPMPTKEPSAREYGATQTTPHRAPLELPLPRRPCTVRPVPVKQWDIC